MSELWVLSGIAVMVLGFVLRFNPLLVVVAVLLIKNTPRARSCNPCASSRPITGSTIQTTLT